MRKTNKKGFTIVELVVVIAVIAILAAVLIPTFSGIIKKANIAADQKAVAEINKQLAMVEAESGEIASYGDATARLFENGIDIADYKPLAKDYTFYYDADLNKVLYVKDHKNVEFPVAEAEAGLDVSVDDPGRWTSLSGEVEVAASYSKSGTTATITKGSEFVKLLNDYSEGDKSVTKIELTADIDLKGASANFGKIANLEFNGNGKTIYGFQANKQAYNADDDNYAFGLFGSVNASANLKVSNLIIDGATVNGIDHSGILVGNVTNGGNLTVNGVTIKNSYVRGMASVGAITGYVSASSPVSLTDVTVSNVTVVGGRGVAKLVGEVQGTPITLSNVTAQDVTVAQDTSFGFESAENASVTFTEDGTSKTRPGWTTKDYWDKDNREAKNFQ